MKQAATVLEIFRELRRAVGDGVPSVEVLKCAASLVELFSEEDDVPAFDDREGAPAAELMPLDQAFGAGGWKTLCREWSAVGWETSDGCGGPLPEFHL